MRRRAARVQMLCFFDYDTGFVTDSGLLTYIYCGAAIGVSLLCMLLCRVDKKLCARIETKKNAAAGASALLMCVFLFLCAAALLRDFYLYRNNQPTYFVQASHVTTHLPFAVLTLLFAIVSLIFAIVWLTGEGFPSRHGRALGHRFRLGHFVYDRDVHDVFRRGDDGGEYLYRGWRCDDAAVPAFRRQAALRRGRQKGAAAARMCSACRRRCFG